MTTANLPPAASASLTVTIPQALDEIRAGRMVIVIDDEDRENEGDLTMAAELVTPEAINFMASHGRGLICLALTEDRVASLHLPMMTSDNRSTRATAFTASIDAREGITTGISAKERAHTIKVAVDPRSGSGDLVMPGHVFPLRGRRGGVLVRSGHTEGAIDLARLAGRGESGVICEIMRDDGEMARGADLEDFARRHGLKIVRIADLIQYRLQQEVLVKKCGEQRIVPRGAAPGKVYRALLYRTEVEDTEYLALVLGEPSPDEPVLVRVQAAHLLRDVFEGAGVGAAGSPGGTSLPPSPWLRMIEEEGTGVFLYVMAPVAARLSNGFPEARDPARPAGDAPLRDFGLGAQVLAELGVRKIRLLTDNPRRIAGLDGFGISVVECVGSRNPASVVTLVGSRA